jgi:hypothetical protein
LLIVLQRPGEEEVQEFGDQRLDRYRDNIEFQNIDYTITPNGNYFGFNFKGLGTQ